MKALTKLILMMISGFLVAVFIFVLLIDPSLGQVKKISAQAADQLSEAQVLTQQIAAYKNSESDLSQVADENDILTRILPRDSLQIAVAEVESAAGKTNIQEGMTIQDPAATAATDPTETPPPQVTQHSAAIEEVPYTISASGSFLSLVAFLQYLEHLPNFTEISEIQIDAATDNTSAPDPSGLVQHTGTLTAEIDGVFFIQAGTTASTTQSTNP